MSQETQSGVYINLEGWDRAGDGIEFQKGGDIYLPMDNSCWGWTENSKILQSNYPSIKNKFFKMGEDICILMADSCWGLIENKIL